MSFFEKIKSGCTELAPDCRAATRAQAEQLDHPLRVSQRLGLWLHLLMCKWCRRYGRQIRFLHDGAHDHQEALTRSAPKNLSIEARERIKRNLKNQH